jgi:hypothetical protein
MTSLKIRAFCYTVILLSWSEPILGQLLQKEWVKTYSHLLTITNQATHIAIGTDGGIVVGGTSQNGEGDLDYQVIKYRPDGAEAWKVRYGSSGSGNDEVRGMTIDPNGNVFVTGTSATVKYNFSGAFVWEVPLAGRAIIALSNCVYVTGFSDTDIATAQLENNDVEGNEVWRRVIDGAAHGTDIGQTITCDANGNVYIAGQEEYNACLGGLCHRVFAAVSYSPSGAQRWFAHFETSAPAREVQVNRIAVDIDGFVYLYGSHGPFAFLAKLNSNGGKIWRNQFFGNVGTDMILEKTNRVPIATGRKETNGSDNQAAFATELSVDGLEHREIWSLLGPNGHLNEGSDIAQDSKGHLYITGYSANDASTKAMFLAKLTAKGQQLALDRFNSPNAGSNFGTALAIDKNDNVYVTGYVQNTQGGSSL